MRSVSTRDKIGVPISGDRIADPSPRRSRLRRRVRLTVDGGGLTPGATPDRPSSADALAVSLYHLLTFIQLEGDTHGSSNTHRDHAPCIVWSLWIRRVTWSCRWEVAATLNIALQGLAVLMMSPLASETLGHWLYSLTGKWNLEDYIGHDSYIVAASAIVYNALGRLDADEAMHRSFKQYVERPATLCIPLLLAAFCIGNGAAVYRPDFFEFPPTSG